MAENADQTEQRLPLATRLLKNPAYPVVYMFAVTFFFTAIVVGVSRATRERVEANMQIMRERAILMATLPDEVDRKTPSTRVHEIFRERVETPAEGESVYRVKKDGELRALALPLEGQGFWDEIKGALGIEPDGETVTGIAFHQQNETPGLGAEITKPHFRDQFQGKKLAREGKPLRLVPSTAETNEHSVHAISGATQTCNRLERIIVQDVTAWLEERPGNEERQE